MIGLGKNWSRMTTDLDPEHNNYSPEGILGVSSSLVRGTDL